jgi:hypothetical protein
MGAPNIIIIRIIYDNKVETHFTKCIRQKIFPTLKVPIFPPIFHKYYWDFIGILDATVQENT